MAESRTNTDKALERLRRDGKEDEPLVALAYRGEGGELLALSGNDDGPYVNDVDVGWTSYTSQEAEGLAIVKTSAGAAQKLHVMAGTSDATYLMIFDAEADLSDGAIPVIRLPLPGSGAVGVDLKGWPFTRGIILAVSSTAATLTRVTGGGYFAITFK